MTDSVERSSNFSFLRRADPLLAQLAASAERYCFPDPNAALLKLRQFGEVVGQHLAAVHGLDPVDGAGQADILGQLQRRRLTSRLSAAYKGLNVLVLREGAQDFFWKAKIQELNERRTCTRYSPHLPAGLVRKEWC